MSRREIIAAAQTYRDVQRAFADICVRNRIWIVTSDIHGFIELLGSHSSIGKLETAEVFNAILEETRDVVNHRIEKDR